MRSLCSEGEIVLFMWLRERPPDYWTAGGGVVAVCGETEGCCGGLYVCVDGWVDGKPANAEPQSGGFENAEN